MSEIIKIEDVTDHVVEVLINRPENYNTLKDKGLINSTTLMGQDQDKLFGITVDRHVNNYVYGENYEVGKDRKKTRCFFLKTLHPCVCYYKIKNYLN